MKIAQLIASLNDLAAADQAAVADQKDAAAAQSAANSAVDAANKAIAKAAASLGTAEKERQALVAAAAELELEATPAKPVA